MKKPSDILIAFLLFHIAAGPAVGLETPPLRRVFLAEPALAATEAGRMRLKYLASCALDNKLYWWPP